MHVKIIGLGWYGEPLAKALMEKGFTVSGTTRTAEKKKSLELSGIETQILTYPEIPSDINEDILILNIPPFSEELDWFKSWNISESTWMIFVSSTSVYPVPESKNAQWLADQEEWVKSRFKEWTILRFGGLIGNGRHPGKYLSGKKDLKGRLWPVNLIALDDTIGATLEVILRKITNKTIHVVSDEHPTREDYYTAYCQTHHLPLPEFDQNDQSHGKIVPNDELKRFYHPRVKL